MATSQSTAVIAMFALGLASPQPLRLTLQVTPARLSQKRVSHYIL